MLRGRGGGRGHSIHPSLSLTLVVPRRKKRKQNRRKGPSPSPPYIRAPITAIARGSLSSEDEGTSRKISTFNLLAFPSPIFAQKMCVRERQSVPASALVRCRAISMLRRYGEGQNRGGGTPIISVFEGEGSVHPSPGKKREQRTGGGHASLRRDCVGGQSNFCLFRKRERSKMDFPTKNALSSLLQREKRRREGGDLIYLRGASSYTRCYTTLFRSISTMHSAERERRRDGKGHLAPLSLPPSLGHREIMHPGGKAPKSLSPPPPLLLRDT